MFRAGTAHHRAPGTDREVQGATPCNANAYSALKAPSGDISQIHTKISLNCRWDAMIILSVIQMQIHKGYVNFTQADGLLLVSFLKWFKSYVMPRPHYYLHFVQYPALGKAEIASRCPHLFISTGPRSRQLVYEECILRWLYSEKLHLNDFYKISQQDKAKHVNSKYYLIYS